MDIDFSKLHAQLNNQGKTLPRCGMSKSMYIAFCKHHSNQCNICGRTAKENKKDLAVDHCHETLKIRGLLCSQCNSALGLLGDDFDSLFRATSYLTPFRD